MNPTKPKRRWLQFSLRMFMAFITLAGVWLGWTMNYLRSLEGQWAALERIDALPTTRPDGSGLGYLAEPATVLGSSLPGRLIRSGGWVRTLDAVEVSRTRAAAKEIPALPHLVRLELEARELTDRDLETLGLLRGLKNLTIFSNFVTGKFLAADRLHDTLESLDIRGHALNNDGARNTGECTHLKTLVFRDHHKRISDWTFLTHLTELEDLTLYGDFPDDALTALVNMPRLRRLDVTSGRLTDKGVAEIAKCLNLEELDLCVSFTEENRVSIQSMKKLKAVSFVGNVIDSSNLEKARPDLKIVVHVAIPQPP